MSIASTIALSGMNVAALRLRVSAGNVANATVTAVSPAKVPAYDPTAPYADAHGMMASPNVDFANEIV